MACTSKGLLRSHGKRISRIDPVPAAGSELELVYSLPYIATCKYSINYRIHETLAAPRILRVTYKNQWRNLSILLFSIIQLMISAMSFHASW